MAKLAETAYRDVNIGLANQFALFAEKAGIDVHRVIEASNSQPYSHIHQPGIAVGGHCIPVYPRLYLSGDADATVVRAAREANAAMPAHVGGTPRRPAGGTSPASAWPCWVPPTAAGSRRRRSAASSRRSGSCVSGVPSRPSTTRCTPTTNCSRMGLQPRPTGAPRWTPSWCSPTTASTPTCAPRTCQVPAWSSMAVPVWPSTSVASPRWSWWASVHRRPRTRLMPWRASTCPRRT